LDDYSETSEDSSETSDLDDFDYVTYIKSMPKRQPCIPKSTSCTNKQHSNCPKNKFYSLYSNPIIQQSKAVKPLQNPKPIVENQKGYSKYRAFEVSYDTSDEEEMEIRRQLSAKSNLLRDIQPCSQKIAPSKESMSSSQYIPLSKKLESVTL
jgi:hypothetical protein